MVVRRSRLAVKPNVGRRSGAKPPEAKKEDASASTLEAVEAVPSTSQPVEPAPAITRIRTRSCSEPASIPDKSNNLSDSTAEKGAGASALPQSPRRQLSSRSKDSSDTASADAKVAKKAASPVKPMIPPTQDVLDGETLRKRKISFSETSITSQTTTLKQTEDTSKKADADAAATSKKADAVAASDPKEVKAVVKPPVRRYIRAKPNLSDAGRQRHRHSSVSSESSDRIRRASGTDKSISSIDCPKSPVKAQPPSTEVSTDDGTRDKLAVSEASPQKPSSITTETCGATESKTCTSPSGESILPAVRKRVLRKTAILDKPVDRSKMTISDLIYMNPTTNRMKSALEEEEKRKEKRRKKGSDDDASSVVTMATEADKDVGQLKDVEAEVEEVTEEVTKEEEDDAVPVPQVTIGPDGNIVLNEQSLVVEAPKDNDVNDFEVVHEDSNSGGYGYNRRMNSKLWTLNETKKFYLALSAIGTDFSLMCKLFANRTRTEIKRKFKKEERCNKPLIDKAIRERHLFDEHFFAELSALDVDQENQKEKDEKKKAQQAKQQKQQKQRGRKKLKVATESNEDVSAPVTPVKAVKRRKGRKKRPYLYEESDSEPEANSSGQERLIDNQALKENGELLIDEGGDGVATSVSRKPVASPICDDDDDPDYPDADHYDFTALEDKEVEVVDVIHGPTRSGRQPKPAKPFTASSPESKRRKTEDQGPLSPFVMPSERTRRASGQKMPGQYISLSNITSNKNTDQMQPGSLVFVTSSPAHKGESSPGMIHVYLVAPPDASGACELLSPPSTSQLGTGESLLQTKVNPKSGTKAPETIVIDSQESKKASTDGSDDEEEDGASLIIDIDIEKGTAKCVTDNEMEEGDEDDNAENFVSVVYPLEGDDTEFDASNSDATVGIDAQLTTSEVPFVPPPCSASGQIKMEKAIPLVADLLHCAPRIQDESPSKKVVYDVADELVISNS